MDNELGLGNEVQGRIFCVTVNGDTAGEIEIAALSAAQEFFGDGVPLEVVQDYLVNGTTTLDQTDKKFRAALRVRALA